MSPTNGNALLFPQWTEYMKTVKNVPGKESVLHQDKAF